MERRIIASAILVFTLLLALAPPGFRAGAPSPDVLPQAITYINSDWVISGAGSNSSEEIILTGNLIIQNGGSLSLDRVTLRMNCAFSGQFRIEVRDGGALSIANGSLITNGLSATAGYLFQVNATAALDVRNSTVSKCGLLGMAGAENSGMRIKSSSATFENATLTGCANGIIADSCIPALKNCTVSNNMFNGISITDAAVPGAVSGAILNNTAISSNEVSGIGGQASKVMATVFGGSIDRNHAGIKVYSGSDLDLDLSDCEVILNTPGGGVWLDGASSVSEIRADVTGCNISGNRDTAVRLGFLGNEVPVKSVFLNMTDNRLLSSNSDDVGVLYALATDVILMNLTKNDFIMPKMKYGLHVGRVIDTLNVHPAPEIVDASLWYNNLSVNGGGVLNICATDNLTATLMNNRIFDILDCGALSIGWFSSGWDDTTPKNMTLVMKRNSFQNIIDGAIGVKAIYNIWADIGENTLLGTYGGGFRFGWLDEGDSKDASELWSKPTRNVRAQIYQNYIDGGSGDSVWIYSSNGSAIFSNTILDRPYSGDGIKIQGSNRPTRVYFNTVSEHATGSGIKLEQASNVSVYSNILENNLYGIGFDRGSHDNIIFSNTVKKTDDKYGFYFSTNSLDNGIPANNTVNGTALTKIHNLHGTAGALVPVTGKSVSRPKMSNLGQIIISNSTYLEVTGNQASNGAAGIALINVQSSDIHGNTLTSGDVGQSSGISFMASSGNAVHHNAVTNNSLGLALMPYSAGNRLWENTVTKFQDSRTGVFIDPNGSAFDNDIPQNNTVNGEPVLYFSGESQVNLDGLNISVGNLTNLGQVFVSGATAVSISDSNITGGISGIHVRGTSFLNVTGTYVDHAVTGLTAVSVADVHITGSSISGASFGLQSGSSNSTVVNSSIIGAKPLGMASSSFSHLINTSLSGGTPDVSADSLLTVEWYLDIMAVSLGLPLSGASVNLTDANGNWSVNGTTGDDGTVPRYIVLEYGRTGNAYDNRTPHSLVVKKDGYSTCSLQITLNRSTAIITNLSDVTAPRTEEMTISPSASVGTSINTIWLNATLDDRLTGNSIVAGAEYLIRPIPDPATAPSAGTAGVTMSAVDGTFDTSLESVTAEVDVSDIARGSYTVWFRGTDLLGNWNIWSPVFLNVTDDEMPVLDSPIRQSKPANLSVGTVWFNATFTDAATGNSNIVSVEWGTECLDTAAPMGGGAITRPLDGSYNEPEEDVSVRLAFSAWAPGDYILRFRAMDSAGKLSNWADAVFAVTDDVAPSVPRGLAAANNSEIGQVVLTWAANSESDLAGYNVYRSTSSGNGFELVTSANRNSTSWTDTGLANGTVYYYRISAFDSAAGPNESPVSAEANAQTIPADWEANPEDGPRSSGMMIMATLAALAAIVILVIVMIFVKRRPKP